MTVMALPENLRRYFRTSNHLERINKELKRRSNVIGIFPNKESLLRIMGSVLQEINEARIIRQALYTKTTFQQLLKTKTPEILVRLAAEQHQVQAAWQDCGFMDNRHSAMDNPWKSHGQQSWPRLSHRLPIAPCPRRLSTNPTVPAMDDGLPDPSLCQNQHST